MKQLTRWHRDQSGQTLLIFVLALGVLMGMMALAIDVGLYLHERRSLQNAADAAALAGAAEFCGGDPTAAMAKALEWAGKNGYDDDGGAAITVTTPYNGDSNAAEVVIETDVPFFFARVLGMDSAHVSARAVASRYCGGGYAIYAHGSTCGVPNKPKDPDRWETEISGSTLDVHGDIHSNADIKINSSNGDIVGAVTYLCSEKTGGQPLNVFGGINQVSQLEDWPVFYDYSDFGSCTFHVNGDMEISDDTPQYWVNETPQSGTLKPGVYCATGDIELSGADFSGNVTFAARHEIHFSGARFDFTPYQYDVVAFAEKSDLGCAKEKCDIDAAIHISSSSFTWRGILLAPRYVVQFSSSNALSLEGSIVGEFVKISASTMNVDAWGSSQGGPPKLTE